MRRGDPLLAVLPMLAVTLFFVRVDPAIATAVPIYPPFMSAPAFSDRELIKVPAIYEEGRWEFPLAGLEAAAAGNARLLLLCNPYNPIGRVLGRDELETIVDICKTHNVIICSDEIHCDLVFDDRKHIPTATLSRDAADITVTLMAPSKTISQDLAVLLR